MATPSVHRLAGPAARSCNSRRHKPLRNTLTPPILTPFTRRREPLWRRRFTPGYDRYAALPNWATRTLDEHVRDPRPALYSRSELERARTADELWNAAQREMTLSGYMHNSMRMYWGKQILQWKATPREAFEDALYLNNKYFLCGRDPASYANIGWVFGLHDRPWPRRPIFGAVRSMNAAGLRRKIDTDAYLTFVAALELQSRA